ncbi:MAG: hypothetical protein HS103_02020 [Anaerolineales bacterium]|nr:hypothetical protein [Anaerolineales bacterium]
MINNGRGIKFSWHNIVIMLVIFTFNFNMKMSGQANDEIVMISISNSGSFVAIATNNGEVKILNTSTIQIINSIPGLFGIVTQIAWSNNDAFIALGASENNSKNGKVYIFDATTGNTIRVFSDLEGTIYSLAWNTEHTQVLIGSEMIDGGETIIGEVASGFSSQISPGPATSIKISPDQSQFAFGNIVGKIRIVNSITLSTEVLSNTNISSGQPVMRLHWSSTQPFIASGHLDGMIVVWNTQSGTILHTLSAAAAIGMDAEYSQMVLALAFDSTGIRLRSFNREGRIRVWDTQTWALIAEQIVPGPIYAADWDKTGTTLYYGTDSAIPRVVRAPDLPPLPTPTALPHPIFPPPGGGQPACPGGGGEWMWVDGELIFVCGVNWE